MQCVISTIKIQKLKLNQTFLDNEKKQDRLRNYSEWTLQSNICLLAIPCCSYIWDTIYIVISAVYHNHRCFGLKWVCGLFQNKIWFCYYSVVVKRRKWNVYVYQKGSLAQKRLRNCHKRQCILVSFLWSSLAITLQDSEASVCPS